MKLTETFTIYSFTPDSYRDYYLPANTRLFLTIFGSAGGKKCSHETNSPCHKGTKAQSYTLRIPVYRKSIKI